VADHGLARLRSRGSSRSPTARTSGAWRSCAGSAWSSITRASSRTTARSSRPSCTRSRPSGGGAAHAPEALGRRARQLLILTLDEPPRDRDFRPRSTAVRPSSSRSRGARLPHGASVAISLALVPGAIGGPRRSPPPVPSRRRRCTTSVRRLADPCAAGDRPRRAGRGLSGAWAGPAASGRPLRVTWGSSRRRGHVARLDVAIRATRPR
jgi:hypothetical protein